MVKYIDEYDGTTLLEVINSGDVLDIEIHKKILNKILRENNVSLIKRLFKICYDSLVFQNEQNRLNIFEMYYELIKNLQYKDVLQLLIDTKFGNMLYLYKFIKENSSISINIIEVIDSFKYLLFLNDIDILEYVPKNKKLYLRLDDRIKSLVNIHDMNKITDFIELLSTYNFIISNKGFVDSLLILYSCCDDISYKNKFDFIDIMINGNYNEFSTLLENYTNNEKWNKEKIIQKYKELYYSLIKFGIPLFFKHENIEFNGKITNNNLYYMLFIDRIGEFDLIKPFQGIEISEIQKIYDLDKEIYFTPLAYLGELSFSSIYSFSKAIEIDSITDETIRYVCSLSENEIEENISQIVGDLDITPHGPTEKIDVWTHKITLDNDLDLRRAGIIIKGKGYEKITLSDVTTNIMKAMLLPIDLVILMYTEIYMMNLENILSPNVELLKKCILLLIELI